MNLYTTTLLNVSGIAARNNGIPLDRGRTSLRNTISRCWFAQQIMRRGAPDIQRPSRKSFRELRLHVPRLRQPLTVKMPF